MSTLYLLNYNNYYNRIVKSTTLANYKSAALYTLKDVNFKPMDSCYTDQIVNISESVNPDYVVITETANNVESIASRWFILESSRTRGNQYKLRLRRDVFVDYNSIVSGATLFCEKGYIDQDNPLIYNSEGNTYNQIKTSEKLLKDKTNCAWLVGYCDYNLMQVAVGNKITVQINSSTPSWSAAYDDTAALLAAYPGTDLTAINHDCGVDSVQYQFSFSDHPSMPLPQKEYTMYLSAGAAYYQETSTTSIVHSFDNNRFRLKCATYSLFGSTFAEMIMDDKNINPDIYQNIIAADQKIVRVGTGTPYRYYKLSVRTSQAARIESIAEATFPTSFAYLHELLEQCYDEGIIDLANLTVASPKAAYFAQRYTAVWEDITDLVTAEISDEVPLSATAPYYMFVMPYYNVQFDDGSIKTAQGAYSLPFVQQLIKIAGTHVLDAQLLPYFPDQYLVHSGVVDFSDIAGDASNKSITWIEDGNGNRVSFIYWAAPQTFTFPINETINELASRKVDNETRFCRLNAPNYSASFDFSIAKNHGVSTFWITCTYRPYQPHIQVTPEWGGIYGQYFQDGRGLICGGDYSIDIINNQWTEYQIMNKNYQLIFDRQIQTMDLQHEVQKINDIFGAASGTLSGAASGAMMGSFLGPAGMGVGALIGGLVSGVGGALDVTNQQKLRTDQREAAFDYFNYNLGNVQARPTTITKMSALVGNNKIWPFYEIYEATAQEVGNLEAQLQYSSMTVKAIGIVSQFVSGGPTFVRGRLIRITGLEHDAEMSQLVADELARGIYMDIQLS